MADDRRTRKHTHTYTERERDRERDRVRERQRHRDIERHRGERDGGTELARHSHLPEISPVNTIALENKFSTHEL
jgi:hypothetical protein